MAEARRRRFVLGLAAACFAPSLARAQSATRTDTSRRTIMNIEFLFGGQTIGAVLYDTAQARELVSMLPLSVEIEDYSTNEKIAYLPRKLSGDGTVTFEDEAVGDICYYAPWGNLVLYHAGYAYSRGLIRLGKIEGEIEPLLKRGKYPLQIRRR